MRAAPALAADAPAPGSRLPGGLVYVDRRMPGLRRVRRGRGFGYRQPDGRWLTDAQEVERIRQLAIPPAYTEVWICPLPHGHLQATGLDARGRRQYRYHPDWRRLRDGDKFERMRAFGQALPRIRARVARDLAPRRGPLLARTRVLAAIVRLLDTTCLRVGNEEYAASNHSYGLTTLRARHADVRGSTLRLRFRGKSGVPQSATLDDPRVARLVRRCQQLPGQELFQYEDADGALHTVGSGDVNDYLRSITERRPRSAAGGDGAGLPAAAPPGADSPHFTAKDFRTWHGTVQALELTRLACTQAAADAQAWTARQILVEVARQLGNTPAVCKKSYVHPAVLELGERLASDAGPGMQRVWERIGGAASPRGLSAAERRLLAFLRRPGTGKAGKAPAKRGKGGARG
ncbi:DNA topoisomerase [Rhodococcus sp. SRB_17]|nr:DNA topoisomerase [Rhodococcus sp. SRB_17]